MNGQFFFFFGKPIRAALGRTADGQKPGLDFHQHAGLQHKVSGLYFIKQRTWRQVAEVKGLVVIGYLIARAYTPGAIIAV